MDLLREVMKLYPLDCAVVNTGNTYEGSPWPEGFTPPSEATIESEMA